MHSSDRIIRLLVALLVAASALGMGGCGSEGSAKRSGPAPRLGKHWAPNQQGYGLAEPTRIFNGGDPTGLVENIRWKGWGDAQAIGSGRAEYVWPGTAVADNRLVSGARVVAFRLGTCRGRRSYNAIEWYFPKYGQTFDPHRYINPCTGAYAGATPHLTDCADANFAAGAGLATEVQVVAMDCSSARRFIASTDPRRYVDGGGRFTVGRFRCGTQGIVGGLDSALFDCSDGKGEVLWSIAG